MYWSLIARWELGIFQFILLLPLVAAGGTFLWVLEGKVRHTLTRSTEDRQLTAGDKARLPVAIGLVAVAVLYFGARFGAPVGGLVVFDADGRPLGATLQGIVTTGGKIRIDNVMLHAFGDGGATRGVLYAGYAAQREPLAPRPTFWLEDVLHATETLEVLATADAVRAAVSELSGIDSRFLHVQADGSAVFERRDGQQVDVSPTDLVDTTTLSDPGCLVDVLRRSPTQTEGLIRPSLVPWAGSGPGCPSQAPPGLALLVSDDAAFGEVRPLVTLRSPQGVRFQTLLADLTDSADPTLIGAVPFESHLVLVAADGERLVFSHVDWQTGSRIDLQRW